MNVFFLDLLGVSWKETRVLSNEDERVLDLSWSVLVGDSGPEAPFATKMNVFSFSSWESSSQIVKAKTSPRLRLPNDEYDI